MTKRRNEWDDIFQGFNDVFKDLSTDTWNGWHSGTRYWSEKDGVYTYSLAVPGVPAKDVAVTITNGKLHVNYSCNNKKYQTKLTIHDVMDLDKIDVCLKLGVLTISVPKKDSTNVVDNKIPIRVE
jgi:HSP20 family molecular chaperone IbpA